MEKGGDNQTSVSEFLLLGLTDHPKLNFLFFMIILLMYFVTIIGNLGMVILICCSSKLHSPMYFFLGNLSFSDLCYSSVITPKLMTNLYSDQKVISFKGCATQLFFFVLFVGSECFLVTVMSYDRYVAICNPLLYTVIMSKPLQLKLVGTAYSGGILTSIIHTSCTFSMTFCGSSKVNHFFCDIPPLLKLSCNNTFISELFMFLLSSILGGLSATVIMFSYTKIISTILRMQSPEAHLLVVALFFGTAIFEYARPISSYSIQKDKIISFVYTVVIPMLNPIIYSLRNAHVKNAFNGVLDKISWK
ncbi:unnamed protein product [Staurois parvus]|uniref:Olfactory receptor n=1 Tax=Staurois parvus TaxID=386267 RepID=A0ABN9E184_9NEOB|nr:unnamed protein product [Staurois parvus]